jgi:hypothetical protein
MAVAGEAHRLITSVAKFANRLPDALDHKRKEKINARIKIPA